MFLLCLVCFSRSPIISSTLALLCPAICLSTQRSTSASPRLPPLRLSWAGGFGKTVCWPLIPNSRYTRHASSVPYCTAVSLGRHTLDRRTAWKASICTACDGSWASLDRTKSPMLLCWRKQVLLACNSCFASVDSVGAVMYVAWRTAVYQRTSCMVSWHRMPPNRSASTARQG